MREAPYATNSPASVRLPGAMVTRLTMPALVPASSSTTSACDPSSAMATARPSLPVYAMVAFSVPETRSTSATGVALLVPTAIAVRLSHATSNASALFETRSGEGDAGGDPPANAPSGNRNRVPSPAATVTRSAWAPDAGRWMRIACTARLPGIVKAYRCAENDGGSSVRTTIAVPASLSMAATGMPSRNAASATLAWPAVVSRASAIATRLACMFMRPSLPHPRHGQIRAWRRAAPPR